MVLHYQHWVFAEKSKDVAKKKVTFGYKMMFTTPK